MVAEPAFSAKTPSDYSPAGETKALKACGTIMLTPGEADRNPAILLGPLTEAGPMVLGAGRGCGEGKTWGADCGQGRDPEEGRREPPWRNNGQDPG